METVTVVLAPAGKFPPFEERVTQFCVFDPFQLIAIPPLFSSV